jgi:lysophospholipase L1-like esterase
MKKLLRFLLPALAVLVSLAVAQIPATSPAIAPTTPPAPVDASAAIPKTGSKRFFELHESFLARGKAGPIGVLFLGDSITEGWSKAPHIWDYYFGKYEPANFGISGDQTQHVIWRIENGELDGLNPKVVVLMIGTNNSGQHTGDQIAAANRKIVELIRSKLPTTKVLVLAIFPRGPRKNRDGTPEPWEQRMAVITAANAEIARLDDGNMIRCLDINPRFLGNDGTIPNIIMPDQLHPNAAGYQLWAEAIQAPLAELMK